MNNTTDKQRAFLLKYISKKLIDSKEEFQNLFFVSRCIGFIVNTQRKNTSTFDIMVEKFYDDSLFDKISFLKKHINSNIQCYSKITDESFSLECIYNIPETDSLYFVFKQSWQKGMSESVTYNYITVIENGDLVNYDLQYEELFKLNINTLSLFFKYLKRNSF